MCRRLAPPTGNPGSAVARCTTVPKMKFLVKTLKNYSTQTNSTKTSPYPQTRAVLTGTINWKVKLAYFAKPSYAGFPQRIVANWDWLLCGSIQIHDKQSQKVQ